MGDDTTNIQLSVRNWRWLNGMKRPNESFDDVLTRLRTGELEHARLEADSSHLPGELDVPGSGDLQDRRRAAIAQLYQYLQDHGTAKKADLLELIDAEAVSYSSADSFWANCIKGRDTLRSLPGVEPPGEGEHTWRYTDPGDGRQ